MSKVKIGRAADLEEGGTLTFQFTRNGKPTDGFLARFHGELVAYENRCRHLPLKLDYDDGRFFSRDGNHFLCQTHNAIYEPLTGLCVQGPCEGESLKSLKIEVIKGYIWLVLD
ncbi:MAG: ferredoxin subunit of nitrite reductase or ring-hydroxylating dioxygenase [Pedosphaera sp.]|nr:ferredoxin subunit of nitrite reductase or ring-hydroxylating dioxygenase [Pedosphaera sp.]